MPGNMKGPKTLAKRKKKVSAKEALGLTQKKKPAKKTNTGKKQVKVKEATTLRGIKNIGKQGKIKR